MNPETAPHRNPINRRLFLGGGLLASSAVIAGCGKPHVAVRQAGSRPDPTVAAGTDLVPDVDHIVIVMMENHSFDNILGTLGRGDGFTIGGDGKPTAQNPNDHGEVVHAFHMPTECQTTGVFNDWKAAHLAYDHGTCQGFVRSGTAEAMGYFTEQDLPFTCSMARTFPIADRYFCSVMAQTYPNRRYLIAGTSLGLIDDTLPTALPPNGVIFQQLDNYEITWKDYYTTTPTLGVFIPLLGDSHLSSGLVKIDEFYDDAATGNLPSVSLLEPNYEIQSEEDPQDVQYGDAFMATVVDAVMSSPNWSSTMLIWTYDEHGGYYDHVPPPPAVEPDDVKPDLDSGDPPGAFNQYGFRVPAGVVSPYARANFVSHTVYDHTSILKTIEEKWNIPSLTRRDANANSMFDMLDLGSPPAFLTPPSLHPPPDPALKAGCLMTGAGTIPPPSAVTDT
ncbi:MAG: alkaline phosphatase family protein [Acidimicrobiales bacterium]